MKRMFLTIPSLALFLLPVCVANADASAALGEVNPNVFGPEDSRTKGLTQMMSADAKRRMQEASTRESNAFAAVTNRVQWEKYRDVRIRALRESLGPFPDVPKAMPVQVTRQLDGDGFIIRNLVFESRPGWWVTANLYLPSQPPSKMPGILISHSHHTSKTHGELQDMGMTWARAGAAVLVPDHFGHGERRAHDFRTEKDFAKPFRTGRQDYFFRYNSNLQRSADGQSLMGWMSWDLMRCVDVLLRQSTIDPSRLLLLGAVAGGGDPAGVTAALDQRITCVVPFNFGGWQPESSAPENPDRDFAWFGDGYWESTRGLRNGARDGFAHFVIVGSVAPRKVIHAHEFAWDAKTDPAWPRLQKIFGFYDATNSLRTAQGAGTVRQSGPGNTHCTHIGAVHRAMIYPALKEWFGMPIPVEYSQRRPAEDLLCWKPELGKPVNSPPSSIAVSVNPLAHDRASAQKAWTKLLGDIEPPKKPTVTEYKAESVSGGSLVRFVMDAAPGIVVPGLFLMPKNAKGKLPVVVMVAQGGKAAFFKERGEVIAAFLDAGVAVCLPDVRGTGETQPGQSAARGSSRTTISQMNLVLGQPVIGSQLRDLRAVIGWLQSQPHIDRQRIGIWGDSFAKLNAKDAMLTVPLDAADFPNIAEPNGDLLALLASLFEDNVKAVYTRGGLRGGFGNYIYVPHDAVVPGATQGGNSGSDALAATLSNSKRDALVNSRNQSETNEPMTFGNAAAWMIGKLR